MTGHCGSLPLLYVQPIMAHTSSKSLVELNTGEHETTFVNITQMLSSLTHTPRLKWLDKPRHHSINLRSCTVTASTYCSHSTTICCSRNTQASCSPKPYSYSKHLLLPQYNHLLLPQHPSKLQPEALQQQPTSSGRHLQLQMFNH